MLTCVWKDAWCKQKDVNNQPAALPFRDGSPSRQWLTQCKTNGSPRRAAGLRVVGHAGAGVGSERPKEGSRLECRHWSRRALPSLRHYPSRAPARQPAAGSPPRLGRLRVTVLGFGAGIGFGFGFGLGLGLRLGLGFGLGLGLGLALRLGLGLGVAPASSAPSWRSSQ